MQLTRITATSLVATALSVSTTAAGEVNVDGVHICCGACIKALTVALAEVEGASNPRFDRNDQSMKFAARDARAASRGMQALLNAGFGGEFTYGDKKLTPRLSKIEPGTKADRIIFTGAHLCCSWCFEDAIGSLQDVDGVTKAAIPKRLKKTPQKMIIVTGKNIDLLEARQALLGAGLFGKLEPN